MKISDLLKGFANVDPANQALLEAVAEYSYLAGRRDQVKEMLEVVEGTKEKVDKLLADKVIPGLMILGKTHEDPSY